MLTPLLLGWLGCSSAPETPPEPAVALADPVEAPAPPPVSTADVQGALARSAAWSRAYPERLAFDAHIGSWAIATLSNHPDWVALDRERRAVQPDKDHEHIRLWESEARLDRAYIHRWTPPVDGTRVNPNRVVTEALYCPEHGVRPQTLAYLCGPMRDEGGYHSTHALWALVLASEAGCAVQPDCSDALVTEMAANQPSPFSPATTLDIDLYGERLLMSCLATECGPEHDPWVATLLSLQAEDGSWSVPGTGEPRFTYHATMIASWALSAWLDKRREVR